MSEKQIATSELSLEAGTVTPIEERFGYLDVASGEVVWWEKPGLPPPTSWWTTLRARLRRAYGVLRGWEDDEW